MCFHYALTAKATLAKSRFKQIKSDISIFHANGFSHPSMPVILNNNKKELSFLNWGIIPHWVRTNEKAKNLQKKTLNARSETVFEKPSFKDSILSKRCLVLAEGYYEYHTYNGKSYPYYISLKSKELFAFAGIWSSWFDEQENKVDTFSILTTRANPLVAKVHNKPKASIEARMPLILDKEKENEWLENKSQSDLKSLFKIYPEELMQAKMIGKIGEMNRMRSLF